MSSESVYSRKNPFPSKLTVNRCLTGAGSNKETRHFELDLAGSGLDYEVGDSLGVFPANDPALVELLLTHLGFGGDETVATPEGAPSTLREALLRNFVITEPSRQLLQALVEREPAAAALGALVDPAAKAQMDAYVWGRDVLDVLEEFPSVRFTPEEFVKVLKKLQPRLYSIASSRRAVGEAVHLTVAVVRYAVPHSPRPRAGVCSTYLAARADGPVPVFVHTAKHFRLPEDPSAKVIMVGPGTGIAPFRAFLQERAASGATGANWLFFGDQKAATDFLYREELEAAVAAGTLARLTTAFSRDQAEKIYVQHRMAEHGAELYAWLEEGAYFYVCGDAKRMAKDVEAALVDLVQKHGGLDAEGAAGYVDRMKKEKRYRKDVY